MATMPGIFSCYCSAYLEMRPVCPCLLKLSLKVNIPSCGAKSLSLQEDCFGV